MIRESRLTSILPPQTSTATFFPLSGVLRLMRAAIAAEPAAANWRNNRFDVGVMLENLQTHGALPGDDYFVVERVNKGHSELLAAAHRFFAGFVIIRAVQNHFRAITFCGRNLYERRGERHADLGTDSMPSGVVGDALRMIARRC